MNHYERARKAHAAVTAAVLIEDPAERMNAVEKALEDLLVHFHMWLQEV